MPYLILYRKKHGQHYRFRCFDGIDPRNSGYPHQNVDRSTLMGHLNLGELGHFYFATTATFDKMNHFFESFKKRRTVG
jgi:hypothetical protein